MKNRIIDASNDITEKDDVMEKWHKLLDDARNQHSRKVIKAMLKFKPSEITFLVACAALIISVGALLVVICVH